MARKFSTALRNHILGANVTTGALTTLSSAASGNKILDSANGLAIFQPGDIITVSTALITAGYGTVVTVIADGSYLTVSETPNTQAAGASYTAALVGKRDFRNIFKNGILEIYSGTQPTDADTVEAGVKLLRITVSSGAVVPGVATNGLNFDAPSAGVLSKAAAETWSGVGLANGTAGWFRFYTNLYQTGAGTTLVRFDGSVSTSGAQLNLSSVSIVTSATTTIDTFTVTLAA
jgi:hypothetical protein